MLFKCFVDCVRVLHCPQSIIVGVNVAISAKVVFICSQNASESIDINRYSIKSLNCKSFVKVCILFIQLVNTLNIIWKKLQKNSVDCSYGNSRRIHSAGNSRDLQITVYRLVTAFYGSYDSIHSGRPHSHSFST